MSLETVLVKEDQDVMLPKPLLPHMFFPVSVFFALKKAPRFGQSSQHSLPVSKVSSLSLVEAVAVGRARLSSMLVLTPKPDLPSSA